MTQHQWLIGTHQADRLAHHQGSPGRQWLRPISANRRLRGPYTAAGAILRAVVPAAPALLVQQHLVEILTAAPELAAIVPAAPETLTSLAVPNERTRYYAALRTQRLAHGLAEFLIKLTAASAEPAELFIDDLQRADYTDLELIGVLLRRLDPDRLRLVLGSTHSFPPREFDSGDDTHPVAAGLPAALVKHCEIAYAQPSEPAGTDDPAAAYLASDCTDDRLELRQAYVALNPEVRRRGHDERAAELQAQGELSLELGAIPFHLSRGAEPVPAGAQALDVAMNHCMRMGFYDATVELCTLGRRLAVDAGRDDLRWHFTAKLPTALSAIGLGERAEAVCDEARAETTDPQRHHQLAYATAMLYTRHLEPGRRDNELATGWANTAIAFASTISEPKQRALMTVFYRNGLALIEAHRGKPELALQLVTDGLAELDRTLAADEQALHRSVLRYNRAQVLNGLRRPDEALAEYRAVIAIDPNYPEYHFDAGNLLRKLGQDQAALAEYELASRLGPPFLEASYNRADVLAGLGRFEEALDGLNYVLELDPNHLDSYVNRAGLLADLGENDRAAADVERGLAIDPDNAHLLALLGRLELEADRPEPARAALDRAIEADPSLAAAWAVRGAAFFALGDLRAALADLDRAAELSPDESVLFNRGSVSLALGRLAEAERDFSDVVALSPDDPDGWRRRAECREAAGDLSGARADRARSARLAGMVAD